jgi:hypothetical protein
VQIAGAAQLCAQGHVALHAPPDQHRRMVKLLKESTADPKQALPQRIKHKLELYEWVRQRVVKYLDIYYPAASI